MIDSTGSKDWILSREDRPVVEVPCPEWGGTLYVRAMTCEAKEEFELWFNNSTEPLGATSRLAALGLCDADGTDQDWQPHEIEELGQKHGGVVERIAGKVKEISYISDVEIEEAEKN